MTRIYSTSSGLFAERTDASPPPPPPTGDTNLSAIKWAPSLNSLGIADGAALLGQLSANNEGGVCDRSVTLNGEWSSRNYLPEGGVGTDDGNLIGLHKFISQAPAEGDEVWMRIWMRQEAGFSWENGDGGNVNGMIKTMRISSPYAGGGGTGKRELQRVNSLITSARPEYGMTDGGFLCAHEFTPGVITVMSADNTYDYVDEQWECLEMYIKVSYYNYIGETRFWRNGVRVGPTVMARNLDYASAVIDSCWFWTYWNGGFPKNQTMWWCRPAVAIKVAGKRDDTPFLDRDAEDFPFIGLAA